MGWVSAIVAFRRVDRQNLRVVVVGDCVKISDDAFVIRNPELTEDDGKHVAHLARYGLEGVSDESIRAAIQQLSPLFQG